MDLGEVWEIHLRKALRRTPSEEGVQIYYALSNGQEAELSSDYSFVDRFVPDRIFLGGARGGASFVVARLTTRCPPAWFLQKILATSIFSTI